MVIDWEPVREIVAPIVGVVGGLGIYYAGTAHRDLLQRVRREDHAKEIEARADDLMRRAHEAASTGHSVMQMVTIKLIDELDKQAAWKLCVEGRARMQGDTISIDVDLLPKPIAKDMTGWR